MDHPLLPTHEDLLMDSIKSQNKTLTEYLLEVCALYNLSKNLNFSLDMEETFQSIEETLKGSLKIDDFTIMLLDESGEMLTVWKASQNTFDETRDVSISWGRNMRIRSPMCRSRPCAGRA